MILTLLVTMAVAWWTWQRNGRRLSPNFLLATLSGLAGVWQLSRGDFPIGAGLMLVATVLYASNRPLRFRRARRQPPPLSAMRIDEARRVLEVGADADVATIRAAHRRLVAKVHPDQGGSADLAARVNLARDVLLAERGQPAR